MEDEYESYLSECRRIRSSNKRLLNNFKKWLEKNKPTQKTITNHINNIDFYINECLLYDEPREPDSVVTAIDYLLGYWFIKKAMWASKSSIKSNATSLKKFYTFMYENGFIDKKDLDEVKDSIKQNMSKWIETLRRYDDPEIEDMEEVWGF